MPGNRARLTIPRLRGAIAGVVIGAAVMCVQAVVEAADLSGPWALEFQGASTTAVYQADCVWEQEGPRITGSCTSGFESIVTVRGRTDENDVSFQFASGIDSGTVMTFTGRLNERATVIEGRWQFKDAQGQTGGGSFTATKR